MKLVKVVPKTPDASKQVKAFGSIWVLFADKGTYVSLHTQDSNNVWHPDVPADVEIKVLPDEYQ